jgi:hypothetical protein
MIEAFGDAWELAKGHRLFITSNGYVKKNGCAVMGRGIAKEASTKFPELAATLGWMLRLSGNQVHFLGAFGDYWLHSFPVKHNWWEKADPELIKESVKELQKVIWDKDAKLFIPRPGCGNGGLLWEDVKPLLEGLDDRFRIVSYE